MSVAEGMLLWEPPEIRRERAAITRYMAWLRATRGLDFASYANLWQWSVDNLDAFWASIWDYHEIQADTPYTRVLTRIEEPPGASWFPGATLNYARQVFRNEQSEQPAILYQSETTPLAAISWRELHDRVAACAAGLRALGVERGDRVVAYLPNIPATVIAFLACAGIGAVWSSCSPDFGSRAVIDRFAQIEPKVLLAIDGYTYNGRWFDRRDQVATLQRSLPTLEHTIVVPNVTTLPDLGGLEHAMLWDDLLAAHAGATLAIVPVPFDHPLWVLYSSGTTGLPKAIVQGHGGILLEHLKTLTLHHDLGPGDRFFWYTTTGWMMWNFLVGGLLVGATILLYDGSAGYPDLGTLWRFAAASGTTFFGAGAGFITACMHAGLRPGDEYDLRRLAGIGSTGSPLAPEGFHWVYEAVKKDVWLASVSGGTDLCTGFVLGCPVLPVRAGELQCRALGARVEAFDEAGKAVVDQVGELVIAAPMPSMPLYLWHDPGHVRYLESYFNVYPGIWRHGDWIKITPSGSCVIYGRSDATINRQGVRMGTSEIYRVVEDLPEVADSLVIDLEALGRPSYMALFVVLRGGATLDEALKARIAARLRAEVSPRHVPDEVFAIAEVPRTLSGKKMEVPVRKILLGTPLETAASAGSMSNPAALDFFVALAKRLG